MRIIKNRQIINSAWQLELDTTVTTLSTEDKAHHKLVSVPQWLEANDEIKSSGDVGVYLQPTDEVAAIASDFDCIPVIAIVFSGFTDGRGYSQAVELREQHHYQNEIRAIGATVDNLSLMERCGINAFQLDDVDLEQALSFFIDIEAVYPYN